MPLEIREIGISMRVGDEDPPLESLARDDEPRPTHEEIVDECVRRVLAMLKTRQER
jgi:hypothetical protein